MNSWNQVLWNLVVTDNIPDDRWCLYKILNMYWFISTNIDFRLTISRVLNWGECFATHFIHRVIAPSLSVMCLANVCGCANLRIPLAVTWLTVYRQLQIPILYSEHHCEEWPVQQPLKMHCMHAFVLLLYLWLSMHTRSTTETRTNKCVHATKL